jgi:hypothetical protein
MKPLRYILLAIILIAIIPVCNAQVAVKARHTITLQSTPADASAKLLSASRDVLLRRLELLDLRDIQIMPDEAGSELVITINDDIAPSELSEVLLHRGQLRICETLDRQDVLKSFGNPPQGCLREVFTTLHVRDTILSAAGPVLGMAGQKNIRPINSCLSSEDVRDMLPGKVKLLWSAFPGSNQYYYLYCISSRGNEISEQDIDEVHGDYKSQEHPVLDITLKKTVWGKWNDITLRNMNKTVAFVIDGQVYSGPRIRNEVPHGKISLTGSGFSKTEVRKLVAIISGGVLPLQFTLVSAD